MSDYEMIYEVSANDMRVLSEYFRFKVMFTGKKKEIGKGSWGKVVMSLEEIIPRKMFVGVELPYRMAENLYNKLRGRTGCKGVVE